MVVIRSLLPEFSGTEEGFCVTHSEPNKLPAGFLVVHGNLPEQLRALLVQWLQAYPLDVFASETVLVQSNGIAQWLKLALAQPASAGGLGIAAGLDLMMPHRFIWQLYRQVLSAEQVPLQCAFDKDQLHWRLLRLLPELLSHADPTGIYAGLRDYLQADVHDRKLNQLALKLADLFDQYQVYRADWLLAWQHGQDVLPAPDGREPLGLPVNQAWQAALWRAILADMTVEQRQYSRASLHQKFINACQSGLKPGQVPARVLVFGVSSLSQQSLQALAAIAPVCQVFLTVHNPCQYFWADIISDKDLFRSAASRQQARPAVDGASANHPLLAAWGKQGRDYIRLLDEFDQTPGYKNLFAGERIDLFNDYDSSHLLAMLQQDILELRDVSESRQHWPALTLSQCQSIQFAICHSVVRELEVLHDDLLWQLQQQPGLQYSDIMVMVPDIDLYSAAIHAVFGRYRRDDPRYIPFTIADQAGGAGQPLVTALQFLLDIGQRRLTVTELVDLLQTSAVAHRFALDDAAVWQLCQWLNQAGAHWGLHAGHRQSVGLDYGYDEYSLFYALRRMLLGYACGELDHELAGVLPLAQISGLAAAACGALADLLLALETWWQQASALQTPAQWFALLQQLLVDFFVASDADETALLASLRQELTAWLANCEAAGLTRPIPLHVISSAWLAGFSQNNVAQRFLSGAVNFATLLPMRAIPFAQVHLLGMQDGAFPRRQQRQDFDLMTLQYRPGDRSRREDDRYLMLEALLSARQRLRISWLGRSVHDNTVREPSVLVAQLRQHLAAVWQLANGNDLLAQITTEYPLKPYSSRYYSGQLTSFQHEWAQYQVHAAGPLKVDGAEPHAETALSGTDPLPLLSVDKLAAFVREPINWFFQERLRVSFFLADEQQQDDERFALDALSHWQVRQQLLANAGQAIRVQQLPAEQALQQACRRLAGGSLLPLRAAATMALQDLQQELSTVLQDYAAIMSQTEPLQADFVRLQLQCGDLQLSDWLSAVCRYQAAHWQLHLVSEPLQKDKRWQLRPLLTPILNAYLSAFAGTPVRQWIFAPDRNLQLPSLTLEQASSYLTTLAGLLRLGWQQPIPAQLKLAEFWCQSSQDDKAVAKLRQLYHGDHFNAGLLSRNAYLARAYPDFDLFWQDATPQYLEQLTGPLFRLLDSTEQ